MAELRLEGVTKRFASVDVLRGVDLVVAAGELLVLVGPSGSGKTTALRIAAGLDDPTTGSVTIADRDVTRLPPGHRNVAMVFQGFALFPHLTAADNIGFGLRARGVGRDEERRRVRDAASLVGCGDLLDRRPAELSGGEQQRVALARALVREPDVFLLDEPLASLDPGLRSRMRMEIRQLHDRLGATMVHVTHDQHEALTLADQVAVLHDGVIQQRGTPDEIYRRPVNRFVATFVGTPPINLFPLEADGRRAGPFAFETPIAAAGAPIEAGVRPEDVRLEPVAGDPRGIVRVVEVAGSDAYVHVEVDGRIVVARVAADRRPSIGDPVAVAADPGRVHRFDGRTGRRVTEP